MTAFATRSGWPASHQDARLGLALATSIVLHLVLLLSSGWLAIAPSGEQPPILQVELSQPMEATRLATHPESVATEVAASSPATSVAPSPTFRQERKPPPRELQGRALDAALAALMRDEVYPRAAIEAGLEGRVVLLLTLDAAGRVTAVELAGSSGHPLLDDAALRAATRVGSLPGGSRQVLLPVDFRLE